MTNIVRLSKDHNIGSFDLDLNEFLIDDAIPFQEKRIANTYVVIISGEIAAYFSLLNDKISRTDVSKNFMSQGLGSAIMDAIKQSTNDNSKYSAFRFLTVDAYLSAVPFYLKNGFVEMLTEQENETTRTMYFDMLSL